MLKDMRMGAEITCLYSFVFSTAHINLLHAAHGFVMQTLF